MARFNYDQLTKIWRASSRDRNLTREDLASVEIDHVTAALLESAPDMSLRAEGHFVYGISQIWGEKAELLLQDSQRADANVGVAFREYLQTLLRSDTLEEGVAERRIAGSSDLELPSVLDLPQSLVGSSARPPVADGDLSIDAVMRGGEEPGMNELSEGEGVVRSAEERAALEDLDLGFGDFDGGDAGDAGEGPGNLDFGSDLAYSSSPPHTPRGDEDLGVAINGSSSPQVAVPEKPASKRRRRGAAIDDVISIARPRRPPPSTLRSISEDLDAASESENDRDDNDDDAYIPLDEATEKLIDPQYVEQEMRRRRHADTMDVEQPADESIAFGDVSFGDNDLDFGGDFDDEFIEDDEAEDTPETLESDQRKARDSVRSALRKKGDSVEFDDLASTSKLRACALMEVLTLAAKGQVQPDQHEAWGSIQLTKV